MRTVVALLTMLVAAGALAADRPVEGRLFVVQNPVPSNPRQREVSARAHALDRTATPLLGDPLADGVTVTFFTEGASSASQAFVLPPGAFRPPNGPGWTVRRTSRRPHVRYSYVDERGENGSVVSFFLDVYAGLHVDIRARASGRGNNPTITVVPPNPGSGGGMTAAIPGGDRFCVAFGGGKDGGRASKRNDATYFKMRFARSATCPALP
jgi:hypothetical protein